MTRRDVPLAAGLFLSSLALLLARWLTGGPIGAADNGDGWRLLCHIGGNDPARISEDWVLLTYPASPACESQYVSTQVWVNQAAQWIGHQLGSSAALNLYVLGALNSVLLAAGVTLLALALPLPTAGRIVSAGLVLLVVADSAVFGWFVSVLSEGSAFLGVLLMTGGLLLLQRADRWRYVGALVTFAGAVLGVNAKAQTLLLLPVLVGALLIAKKSRRTFVARWALPVLLILATASATVLVQRSGTPAGGEYEQVNAYHTVFNSIVREDSAAADLAAFGLPESWAGYQGTSWWGEETPAYLDPLWAQYQGRVSREAVIDFYLEHPVRTLQILHVGAQDLLTARPENIGSYPEASGEPAMAQEFRVPVLSGLTRLVAPLGLFALAPLWLLTFVAGVVSWRRARPVAVLVLFLLAASGAEFAVAALGEGIEGVKHQVIALFCTLLGAVLAAIALWARRHLPAAELPHPDDAPEAVDRPVAEVSAASR